jgi:hypothetical protein
MILDSLLTFTGTSQGATGGITAGAQTDSPTTGTQIASNIIDLGVTSGVPTSANGGGARDIGVAEKMLKLSAICPVAFVGGTSLQIELAGAPDNGSGAPGTYTVMWLSPAYAEANLVAGAQLANVDVPRVIAGQPLPRFLRERFISVGTHTGGTIESQIVLDRFDQIVGGAGNLSGYPAGINIAN